MTYKDGHRRDTMYKELIDKYAQESVDNMATIDAVYASMKSGEPADVSPIEI